jgi:DNA-binding transcriptional regulator YiaG
MHSGFVHDGGINANYFSFSQANNLPLCQITKQIKLQGMVANKPRPFADIAERLKWHRSLVGLKQDDYAATIGTKRSALSLWEAGTHRLSLDGALALRNKYGLSLDFMYEGIDDALPMTLRNAWIERPAVKASK